jgi:hypothetical protein
MNLPIPNSRSGIFAGLSLTVAFFCVYYFSFYSQALHFYEEQFQEIPPYTIKNIVVTLRVPKYVSNVIPGWLYVRIERNDEGTDPLLLNVSVLLNGERIIQLPSLYREEIFSRSAETDILPHSAVYLRLPLSTKIEKTADVQFLVNGNPVPSTISLKSSENPWQALRRVIVENLLLPPWSNIIIPVFAFLCVYLLESENDEKKYGRFSALTALLIFGLIEGVVVYQFLEELVSKRIFNWFPFVKLCLWFAVLVVVLANKDSIWSFIDHIYRRLVSWCTKMVRTLLDFLPFKNLRRRFVSLRR